MRTEEIKAIAKFMILSTQLHLVEHPITGEYVDPDMITASYQACIQFITWYNTQN